LFIGYSELQVVPKLIFSIAIKRLQDLYLGWLVFTGVASLYAFLPLLSLFDPNPPEELTEEFRGDVENTALVIPAYKSEKILPATIVAALKIFPAEHIFVICNGNSPTPLDNSEDVCNKYGVNHIWYTLVLKGFLLKGSHWIQDHCGIRWCSCYESVQIYFAHRRRRYSSSQSPSCNSSHFAQSGFCIILYQICGP